MARSFEYDIKRLQEDGALMAELAASSQVLDTKSNVRWFWRQKEQIDFKSSEDKNKDFIKRQFWLKGTIIDQREEETDTRSSISGKHRSKTVLTLKFSCAEDNSHDWHSQYCGVGLSSKSVSHQYDPRGFDSFVSSNFKASDIVKKDPATGVVIVDVVLQTDQNTREDLLSWAKTNMRSFNFENFSDDLLLKSPRQLGNNDEKERIYALSEHVNVLKHQDKIDFFISHSWDDDPVLKCSLLKKFSLDFKDRNGRWPTYWFDKCCIDQRNPGNALAVLPINIGACNKFLILMSESYLHRLWCVWEVFTLFTFCNKELALERIELLPLVDKSNNNFDVLQELENFDIDRAHCFDPNEEFKLRNIMHDVGIDRLKTSINHMAKLYKSKDKHQVK